LPPWADTDHSEFSSTKIYGLWCLEVSRDVWIYIGRRRFIHNPCTVQLSARNHVALPAVGLSDLQNATAAANDGISRLTDHASVRLTQS
jgi:hypothetical protein